MLQILKRKDADGYEDILSACGLTKYGAEISEAIEKDSVVGYGVYKFFDDFVCIYAADANGDLALYDGIIRSILFLAALKGIEKAVFALSDKSDAVTLGFITLESDKLESISTVLGGCGSCKGC